MATKFKYSAAEVQDVKGFYWRVGVVHPKAEYFHSFTSPEAAAAFCEEINRTGHLPSGYRKPVGPFAAP